MKLAINGATTMPYSLEEDIKAASEVGFGGIEIWWNKVVKYLNHHSSTDLLNELKKYNVKPVGICPFLVSPFRDTEELRNEFKKALEAADAIHCDLITICPDYRPMKMSVRDGLKLHAKEFAWYAKSAEVKGIRLAVEPIGCHTLVSGPQEALQLIESAGNSENLGIVLDTFHYSRSGVTKQQIMDIPAERLFMVHINDSEEGMAEELQDKHRLYPFEGCLDLEKYKTILKKINYDGYCSVEVFRPEYWEQDIKVINERSFKSGKKFI